MRLAAIVATVALVISLLTGPIARGQATPTLLHRWQGPTGRRNGQYPWRFGARASPASGCQDSAHIASFHGRWNTMKCCETSQAEAAKKGLRDALTRPDGRYGEGEDWRAREDSNLRPSGS